MLDIKPEVYQAIIHKRAVVALESTIITHGMPYPENLKTAIEVEETVRAQVNSEKIHLFFKMPFQGYLSISNLFQCAQSKFFNIRFFSI
jgi:hypothetical protein